MNDTMSLLLATAILATGGVCLYMYKSPDDEQNGVDESGYNEDSFFGSGNFWGSKEDEKEHEKEDENEKEDEPTFYEPKVRTRGGKTKRSRKTTGTKRRY
jgi:hypothetical protein